MTIKVLLADDQALVRAGFRSLLARSRDITVVGEAQDGEEAVRLAASTNPDVVLMDIRMPGTDGITATRRILTDPSAPGCRVIILTTFDTDEHVFAALRAGASGFLTKEVEPAELRRAVAVVAGGDALLSPGVTRRVIEQFAHRQGLMPGAGQRLAVLTSRELETVRLVALGLSNSEIAERLVISPLTAKTHITRAIAKLNVRDRVQLVILAYESGLIRPGV
ncbi:DNA-binding response regulator, NarL/FixJ family, contains REC and HTH domains [Nonomuraea maritima]|uniref:DNA-binding response regulator, NarL/FixJ family, contains REC and HTH domains n=1 Tax=Nonomuraea maritima TaxID=683260 RepID=A0A1G9D7U7_9ACTN|nr:response regulator transcription factor [Nonomuraea maritima]SDK59969.1 DNA-binding response regulator, NarL/FixJ family, contains REC and HTH domains [Nonomuraea maritima]